MIRTQTNQRPAGNCSGHADRLVLANATLVLEHETITGSVTLENGSIAELAEGASVPPGATDCEGDFVCPGLVELHTDNVERHLEPRPGARWPREAAIIAHDAEFASVGVTTVFDALRIGSMANDSGYGPYARETADAIATLRASGALRIEHKLHLRAEVCSETLAEELDQFHVSDDVGVISIMDHTPGQRQFRDLGQLEVYLRSKRAMSRAEIDDHLAHRRAIRERFGPAHEAAAVDLARRLGAVLASHDDTTEEDVARSVSYGAGFAEFPVTEEAALACSAASVPVMMGAPNLLRGGSHSGNVSAMKLAAAGLLDILSSDYAPSSLLHGAVRLGRESGNMAAGLRCATRAPALAVGLSDRGLLAEGSKGDVLRFRVVEGVPVCRGLWRDGVRVA